MSVAGFGDVALGAAGGVASAGGLARVTIATTVTDSRTNPKSVLVAPRGRPVLCNAWQSAIERGYEVRAFVAQRETAWL